MPIYEYECAACRKTFEKLERSMSTASTAAQAPKCPTCGSPKTSRKLSAVAAIAGTKDVTPAPQGCGRCGGPNPCGMG